MADARDSKSRIRKGVWVQVPPPVLNLLLFFPANVPIAIRRLKHRSLRLSIL